MIMSAQPTLIFGCLLGSSGTGTSLGKDISSPPRSGHLSPLTVLNLQARVSSTLSRTVAWTDMLSQGAFENRNL